MLGLEPRRAGVAAAIAHYAGYGLPSEGPVGLILVLKISTIDDLTFNMGTPINGA